MALAQKDLLSIDTLSRGDIEAIFKAADSYIKNDKLVPFNASRLAGKYLFNLFFENSTRTLTSFELAGKRLGAKVTNFHIAGSSLSKGETIKDTILTLNAMEPDFIVVRHGESGMSERIAAMTDASVINAGDGCHEHPTQGLLDGYTILKNKGSLKGLSVTICGDILHSRVARSNIKLLTRFGAKVTVSAPPTLMPAGVEALGVTPIIDFDKALKGADVIILLRIQKERMTSFNVPSEAEYKYTHGLDRRRLMLAKRDAIVLHPGPINRGVEITDDVADDPKQSMILKQVKNGVAIREAVLELLSKSAKSRA